MIFLLHSFVFRASIFLMAAARNIFVPPQPTDSLEVDRPIEPGVRPTLPRVAGLLRRLINYGKEVINAVRLRASTPAAEELARSFRTSDLGLIIARIGVAISRAVHLEDKLLFEHGFGARAAVMRDRAERRAEREAARAAAGDAPASDAGHGDGGAARTDGGPDAVAAANKPARPPRQRPDKRNRIVPSMAQIIAELRYRSVGAILADICRDLGITEQHPLWPQVAAAISAFGGTRWCSRTWLDLPYPRGPVIPTFSMLKAREHYIALSGQLGLPSLARATGPP
jgi:hypothetical protein